jgi:hypothetical protein
MQRPPGELQTLLAAVLEADHTLVTGSDWTYGELEQLILMLPPRLRPDLTFHTYALALPREPVPRLVMTPLHDEWPFRPETGTWGHRLPQTRLEISSHAQESAADLVGLLDAPELLGEAQEAYERYVARFKPKRRLLLEEVDTLLRLARLSAVRVQGEAGAALRVLSRAVGSHGSDVDESEMMCLLDILQEGFAPESMGTAVAECIRNASVNPVVPAVVLERYLSQREADPAAFAAFARPLANVSAANLIASDERTGRRVATMLALLAAARGDAAGLVASAHPPLDRDAIDRVGGIDAWAPRDAAVGWALRALADARTPEDLVDALRAIAALRGEITPGRAQIPLVELGVACMRWGYRNLPREAWEVGLQIGIGGLNLCHAVTTTGRISLDGRTDADLLKEMLDRTASPKGLNLSGHSDAEIFLGFLGVQASRSRPALWEIPERGDSLVKELFERIRKTGRRDEVPGEGIHWSLALLDRVRRHEVDGQYVPLAAQLLRLSAGASAREILRWYLEAYPALGARIREDASSQGLVDDRDVRAAADVPGEAEPTVAAFPSPAAAAPVAPIELPTPKSGSVPVTAPKRSAISLIKKRVSRQTKPPEADAVEQAPGDEDVIVAVKPSSAKRPRAPRRPLSRHARRALIGGTFGVAAAVLVIVIGNLRGPRVDDLSAVDTGDAEQATLPLAEAPAALAATDAATAPPTDAGARLEQARAQAASADWRYVVELLSVGEPDSDPEAVFAWDSLLARGALYQANMLPNGDSTRSALLNLAHNRTNRALGAVPPFAPGTEELRLVRAETCITGGLDCEALAVMEDLVFAARSKTRSVSDRAATLLGRLHR